MRPTEVMLSIGRPIAYYPKLAKHVGGVKPAYFCASFSTGRTRQIIH